MKLLEQPTDKTCCQTIVAMLAGVTPEQVIAETYHSGRTRLPKLRSMLKFYDFETGKSVRFKSRDPWQSQIPFDCYDSILKIRYRNKDGKLSKNWHASLYHLGRIYDPAYGINPSIYHDPDIVSVYNYLPVWKN